MYQGNCNVPTWGRDTSGNVTGLVGASGNLISIVNKWMTSRRFGPLMTKMPFAKLKVSSFTQTTGSLAFSSHLEMAVESPFDAVRFVLPNNTNAISGLIGKCATAAAAGLDPSGNTANADGLTQNNNGTWSSITWDAASSVSWAAGTGVQQPTYTVSDMIAQASADRTDSATQSSLPLIFARFEIPVAAGVVNIPQWSWDSDLFGQHGYTGNWGNDVSNVATDHRFLRNIYQNTAGVTTLANFTQSTLQCGIPVCVQYVARRSGINIMIIGDSVAEGSSPAQSGVSTTRAWGWVHQAAYAESTQNLPIEVANFGWGGQTSTQYAQRFIDLMKVNDPNGFPVFRPDILVFSPFTSNDGTPSAATIATQSANAARVLSLCQMLGILPIIYTGTVVDSYDAPTDAYRAALVTRILAMGVSSDFVVMDTASIWGTGASPNRWATGMGCSDGLHPSDAGKTAAAQSLRALLSYVKAKITG